MTNTNLAVSNVVVTKMSSREVATITGKNHSHIVRDIEMMLESLGKHYPNLDDYDSKELSIKRKIYNGRVVIHEILLDHDLTMTLMTGYSVPLRHKMTKRWRELETGQAVPVKSNSGLPEYRRARTLKMSVDAVSNLFNLMPHLSNESKQCAAANIINPIVGFEAVPLPVLEEKYYTAGEVGKMLELSANKIGRIANNHNLKTEQYGKFFLDKSAHSDKQVEAFRYNENGIKALRHLIHGVEVA
uniref:Rha family transcriptional regulator n=1 Tax=Photorhabdus sp. RM322S TaxID=3342825 RepID=UPI0036D8E00E